MFLNELWALIKRNIFVVVLMVTLAVAVPWTLVFIIPIALVALAPIWLVWRVQKAQKDMFGGQTGTNNTQQQDFGFGQRKQKNEGKVTVVQSEPTEQRVNDDVGEYVDFKEIKEDKSK